VHVVDDWKLKRTTVVRIERPNKTFVHFVCLFFFVSVCLFLKLDTEDSVLRPAYTDDDDDDDETV